MSDDVKEILEVHNFLSIKDIKWEIKQFNIITGDMGSGKSLCIKLVQFFEGIIQSLLIMPYETFFMNLESKNLFNSLATDFKKIFAIQASGKKMLPPFIITYTFSFQEEEFSVTVTGTDEENISIESFSLKDILEKWSKALREKGFTPSEKVTPDGFKELKMSLYNDLLKGFNNHFPIATIFVPASRAALAFSSSHTDNYLVKYKELVDFLPRFEHRNQELVKTILKANIEFENNFLFLVSDDGRKVSIAKASSGQQEIVYVLMLLDRLGNFQYTYGNHQSVFIEEPEAHLFPLEQKQTIELIVHMYESLKGNGNPVRFFITTHSPYLLNVVNNMLRKGSLVNEYSESPQSISILKRIDEEIKFPCLFAKELSAIFIDEDGIITDMIDPDEEMIFADKIAAISYTINEDTIKLDNLNNELIHNKETEQ